MSKHSKQVEAGIDALVAWMQDEEDTMIGGYVPDYEACIKSIYRALADNIDEGMVEAWCHGWIGATDKDTKSATGHGIKAALLSTLEE